MPTPAGQPSTPAINNLPTTQQPTSGSGTPSGSTSGASMSAEAYSQADAAPLASPLVSMQAEASIASSASCSCTQPAFVAAMHDVVHHQSTLPYLTCCAGAALAWPVQAALHSRQGQLASEAGSQRPAASALTRQVQAWQQAERLTRTCRPQRPDSRHLPAARPGQPGCGSSSCRVRQDSAARRGSQAGQACLCRVGDHAGRQLAPAGRAAGPGWAQGAQL